MSKEITLNVSERVEISKILNSEKVSDLGLLGKFIDDMKNVVVTEAEWTAADLKKTPVLNEKGESTGQETWNWNDKPELDKVIILDSDVVLTVLNAIKAKESAKEITMADKALITLKAKLQ